MGMPAPPAPLGAMHWILTAGRPWWPSTFMSAKARVGEGMQISKGATRRLLLLGHGSSVNEGAAPDEDAGPIQRRFEGEAIKREGRPVI